MEKWKLYAFAAAVFAGLTSVIAKAGLKTLSADVALAVRTAVVFVLITANAWLWTGSGKIAAALSTAGWRSFGFLALSGLTTALSWICYFRAMKDGTVSYVSLLDKSSILITLALSVLLLGEPFTWRLAAGATLICGGLVLLATGK